MTESPELRAWLERVEARHPGDIALGLDRVGTVAARMGLRQAPMPIVLVGGTNGKGSVVSLLESALIASGHRVGAYTSPHLFRFNERIRKNGLPVSDEGLLPGFAEVEEARGDTPLTYFEFTTLVAMATFREEVDIAVLEVGLGGRLDAVNIWDPLLSVVTSVDLDHQAFLGEDREAIGAEKAGIFRPETPALCGDPQPPESLFRAPNGGLWVQDRDFRGTAAEDGWWSWSGCGQTLGPLPQPRLAGDYQIRNAATAIAAGLLLPEPFRLREEHWRVALARVALPGRGQCLPGAVPIWLDVAHNPAAAREFAALLSASPPEGRTLAVYGSMQDKDVGAVAAAMAGVVDRWYPCGVPVPRGMSGAELAETLPVSGPSRQGPFPEPADALDAARQDARPERDRIVIFGSFLMVAAALEALDVTSVHEEREPHLEEGSLR
ncbi:bifunctional folylpolyglutamate synthase/dihydrofolate synthase [Thiohalorhabdus sp. Cl-TMA]|uniref:Dihydrofolate synthase/folylpolyglutamate synthase n=1 Tax=Thiohalorhabdus methylotrophus TaxID=3242694 RepID=A0ABV4TW87_9GAMM